MSSTPVEVSTELLERYKVVMNTPSLQRDGALQQSLERQISISALGQYTVDDDAD